MNTEPNPGPGAPAAPPAGPPRRRWVVRALVALLMVGLPAAGAAGLGWLWARGLRFAEVATLAHDGGAVDPATGAAATCRSTLRAESALGVLGLTLTRDRTEHAPAPADVVAAIRKAEAAGSYGWHAGREDKAWLRKPTQGLRKLFTAFLEIGMDDYLPFGRDRDVVDAGRTLHWRRSIETEPAPAGGTRRRRVDRLVMPAWLWMLPLALPPLWWAWCPRGRPFPRLTIRRTLIATALAALALAPLAQFARASAADRALEVLDEAGAAWDYGPDPDGSGRRVVTGVTLGSASFIMNPKSVTAGGLSFVALNGTSVATRRPDAGRLHDALARLPGLRTLDASGLAAATGADLAALIGGLPRLEVLKLERTQADDATLGALRGHPALRELYLDGTAVTDAGLAHLRGLPNLEVLWLDGTDVGDAGLAHLEGMPRLRRINLSDGKAPISEDALRRLARSLPAFEAAWRPDGSGLGRPAP